MLFRRPPCRSIGNPSPLAARWSAGRDRCPQRQFRVCQRCRCDYGTMRLSQLRDWCWSTADAIAAGRTVSIRFGATVRSGLRCGRRDQRTYRRRRIRTRQVPAFWLGSMMPPGTGDPRSHGSPVSPFACGRGSHPPQSPVRYPGPLCAPDCSDRNGADDRRPDKPGKRRFDYPRRCPRQTSLIPIRSAEPSTAAAPDGA
jgi:hypothetical protein